MKKEAAGVEAVVRLGSSRDANVRFGANEIESCGDVSEARVQVDVAIGKRHAAVSGNQTGDASLAALAKRAVAMAKIAPEDPERMPLVTPQTYATVPAAFDPALADMSSESRAATAQAAIVAIRQAGLQGAGFFQHTGGASLTANSAGLVAHYASTYGSFSMHRAHQGRDGLGVGDARVARARAIDATGIARVAIDKASRSAKPRPLDPASTP